MHVVFSFTIKQSKRKQIDEHIFNFEQYHAAKKEGRQTKPRDSDTAGVNATELKVRYPQNSGKFTYTHDLDHPASHHAPLFPHLPMRRRTKLTVKKQMICNILSHLNFGQRRRPRHTRRVCDTIFVSHYRSNSVTVDSDTGVNSFVLAVTVSSLSIAHNL